MDYYKYFVDFSQFQDMFLFLLPPKHSTLSSPPPPEIWKIYIMCVGSNLHRVWLFVPSNIQHHVHYVNYSKHSAREISSHIIYLVTHSILMYSRVQKIRGILNAHSFTPTADSLFESCDVSPWMMNRRNEYDCGAREYLDQSLFNFTICYMVRKLGHRTFQKFLGIT